MNLDRRTTWETYVSAWKHAAPADKSAALARSVAPECLYRDPLAVARGHAELLGYMQAFQQQVPGGHFVTTRFLALHDASIAQWNMVDGQGQVIGDGVSHGRYDDSGALVEMTGFFEPPPQP